MKAFILVLTFFCILVAFSHLVQATQTLVSQPQMKMNESSTLIQTQQYKHIKLARTCSYQVNIYTSCHSPDDANDEIFVQFGDAYGTKITAQLTNVGNAMFKPCMVNSFRIIGGECMNKICMLALQREGNDGWIAALVTVDDLKNPPITFYFNYLIPNNRHGYGYNLCEKPHSEVST